MAVSEMTDVFMEGNTILYRTQNSMVPTDLCLLEFRKN
jgi:hypothetical protein